MEKQHTITFVGGDKRTVAAAGYFEKKGAKVFLCGFDAYEGNTGKVVRCKWSSRAVAEAELVVLPLPYTRDGETVAAPFSKDSIGLGELFSKCESIPVCGGMLPEGENRFDYYDEVMVLQNADVTAEAALVLGGQKTEKTLRSASVLISGYGRIGKALAAKLKAVGADVTVIARKEKDRVLARLAGCMTNGFETAKELLAQADLVFNTVPDKVFAESVLDALPDSVPVIDLANALGGKRTVNAKGLPGTYAPEEAGIILAGAAERVLERIKRT